MKHVAYSESSCYGVGKRKGEFFRHIRYQGFCFLLFCFETRHYPMECHHWTPWILERWTLLVYPQKNPIFLVAYLKHVGLLKACIDTYLLALGPLFSKGWLIMWAPGRPFSLVTYPPTIHFHFPRVLASSWHWPWAGASKCHLSGLPTNPWLRSYLPVF